MKLGRRGAIGLAVAAILCVAFVRYCVRIVPPDAPKIDRPRDLPAADGTLLIPVEGVPPDALTDTYTQARQQGQRRHDAIDILAARGRAVLAVADGRIERIFWSERGGRTLYQRSADGTRIYYYAHLDSYAPGLAEGRTVRRGQRLGTVGATGNADPAAPHLHFEVHAMAPNEPWYGGRPLNPYPMLATRR